MWIIRQQGRTEASFVAGPGLDDGEVARQAVLDRVEDAKHMVKSVTRNMPGEASSPTGCTGAGVTGTGASFMRA